MNNFSIKKIFENIAPFLVAGIAIVLFFYLFLIFSYLLIWGLVIGGVLWMAVMIKQYLFPPASTKIEIVRKEEGRIIEHDDKK